MGSEMCIRESAVAVVNKYNPMVLVAIDPSLTMLDKEDIPETREKKTRGTTTSIRRFLNTWPPKLNKYFSINCEKPSDIKPSE